MGVPSYFSYIIKEHRDSILTDVKNVYARLYMDCNSILYDSYREIDNSSADLEMLIIKKTIDKIKEYILTVSPTDIVFIAFDGVAPFAKMEQQRNRRYKSWFESSVFKNTNKFSSCIFTPGTEFMKLLSSNIQTAFLNKEEMFHVRQIIVSTSEYHGEGEHKLFKHIRENPENCKTAIYGLDADLIMLSLFHMVHCELYVFREAPEFMKLQITMNSDAKIWFLNITKLSHSIDAEMRCSCPSPYRVYDYAFLCFFLGNDFLPHFPALNIRTNGMQRLLDTYRICIGNAPHRFLLDYTNNPKINWRHLAVFVKRLAQNEHTFILQEYAFRKKWDNRPASSYPQTTVKETEELFQMTPVLFREEEKYINPSELYWEERYYKRLFIGSIEKTDICVNYLEGLEWVLSYYTSDCRDWRWKYRYSYPPLLSDLLPIVPKYDVIFLKKCSLPFSPNVQLAYVLPFSQLHLLPDKIYSFLIEKHRELYIQEESKMKFQWSFCRHFWESHVILPDISLPTLIEWESVFSK